MTAETIAKALGASKAGNGWTVSYPAHDDRNDADKTEYPLGIWQNSNPVPNTLAGTYLQSRGLHLTLQPTLRFHGRMKQPSSGLWPAMVALVSRGQTIFHWPFIVLYWPVTCPERLRSIPRKWC